MLINCLCPINRSIVCILKMIVTVAVAGVRAVCDDELYALEKLGILCCGIVKSLAEKIVMLIILCLPLLVTYCDVVQRELPGMAHVNSNLAPFRVCAAAAELHKIQGILHVLLEFCAVYRINLVIRTLDRAGHAGVEHGNRLAAKSLAKLEIFIKTYAVSGVVRVCVCTVPDRVALGARCNIAHCCFAVNNELHCLSDGILPAVLR